MSDDIHQIKHKSHVTEWSDMVQQCRNSGMTVRSWCRERGINEKTYYNRQKQVCNALQQRISQPVQFAEISQPRIEPPNAEGIRIRIGVAEVIADDSTDLELLRGILRIVAEIC